MPSAHLKDIVGTLRFRLTVWNTAVVLSMVLFTLWGVREGLRLVLWHEADAQLAEDAREARLIIEQFYPNLAEIQTELERKAVTHTHHGFYVRLFDGAMQPVWASSSAPPFQVPTPSFEREPKPITLDGYRLMHSIVNKAGLPELSIHVGISVQPLESDVAQITRLTIVVGAVVLIVSPLGGYWLAGRATQPVAKIIDTTARLHPGSLHERLRLRGTGDELDRLSGTINGFLDRIAAYIAQNRDFTANAAHELRSPLAAIQNSLEVGLNADRTTDEYKDLLTVVLDECEQLRVLVNQLLLLAESDAGRLQDAAKPVRFDQIVGKAIDMFRGVAEAAEVDLRRTRLDAVVVSGDAGSLRQVVNNLLDNAIKFTHAGGTVTVELTANSHRKLGVLTVSDTGIGIPETDLPHIFDRFYRADKSRGREKLGRGTGLGMAICRSIVVAHNGYIDVQSAVDRGTTFTVTFPAVHDSGVP